MTKVILLDCLKDFTEDTVKDLLLPVEYQKGDKEPPLPRAAAVYRTHIPDGRASDKRAPYILHQILTGKDVQPPGQRPEAVAVVRSIFCVYHQDKQEGGLALLNLMEQMRISLLSQGWIGKQFQLDIQSGMECLVYPEEKDHFFAGEMITVWRMTPVTRIDAARIVHGLPPYDPCARHLEETIKLKGNDENGKEND